MTCGDVPPVTTVEQRFAVSGSPFAKSDVSRSGLIVSVETAPSLACISLATV
uniref:Uncharacterized protein n=1 Tax=uncultured marine virus TaxID=186617 RepID=A0A0F7L5D4_9VIRU|nr:hypothetical protein [uncultured marine virus]